MVLSTSSSPKVCLPARQVATSVHIEHPQLRDLLVSHTGKGHGQSVIHCTRDGLVELDMSEKVSPRPRPLSFSPTCIATGSGLVAAGGQRAEIFIAPVSSLTDASETSWSYAARICGIINNSLFITNLTMGTSPWASTSSLYESSQNARLFVSNNDMTLKCYNVATRLEHPAISSKTPPKRLSNAGLVHLPTSVNHASLSPDGRTLIAVGDTNDIFLYDVRGGDNVTFDRVASYKVGEAAGCTTAWSSDGLKFASSSEDGTVTVWDVRSSIPSAQFCTPLREKAAGLPNGWSAGSGNARYWMPRVPHADDPPNVAHGIRTLKFSPTFGGRETLVFSEHTNNIHVIDARTFNDHSIIRVPRFLPPAQPSSVSFMPPTPRRASTTHLPLHPVSIYSHQANKSSDRLIPPTQSSQSDPTADPPRTTAPSCPSSPHPPPRAELSPVVEEGVRLSHPSRLARENTIVETLADPLRHVRMDIEDDSDSEEIWRSNPFYQMARQIGQAPLYHQALNHTRSGVVRVEEIREGDENSEESDEEVEEDDGIYEGGAAGRGRISIHAPSTSFAYDSVEEDGDETSSIPEWGWSGETGVSPQDDHLTGLCFDASGRWMYVGTEKSVVQYDMGELTGRRGGQLWGGGYEHGSHWTPRGLMVNWESSEWA